MLGVLTNKNIWELVWVNNEQYTRHLFSAVVCNEKVVKAKRFFEVVW